jgi:hypothetical protein
MEAVTNPIKVLPGSELIPRHPRYQALITNPLLPDLHHFGEKFTYINILEGK